MKTRREFVKLVAGSAFIRSESRAAEPTPPAPAEASAADDRSLWLEAARRLATPVLTALAQRRLKATMPVEARSPDERVDRAASTHLEAIGRLLAGLAPWLELAPDPATPEGRECAHFGRLAREGLDAASDPHSPDFVNFATGTQRLVDAAFLAQALLRAPTALWAQLEPRVRTNLIAGLKATRPVVPYENNWQLFAAMIEVALHRFGEKRDEERLGAALAKFREWYVGDGMYGDGPEFHWDYYNAFVIQPMLVETLDAVGHETAAWSAFRDEARLRLTRFAAIQERLIAPDGSYPVIGRSITYRCGAFQGLALAALRQSLPAAVKPGQARAALTAVIRRSLWARDTFDAHGWLQIGLSGHQPALGEYYISTGSLYLCSVALLPLGLPARDPFWREPRVATSWERVWSGQDLIADHALESAPAHAVPMTPASVVSLMEQVADWQLAHPAAWKATEWENGPFYAGVIALSRLSGSPRFHDAMMRMGEANHWQLGPLPYHADDHVVGQAYAELYLQDRDPRLIAPLQQRFDFILAHPRTSDLEFDWKRKPQNLERWIWCDALFMAPPAWIRLWAATGRKAYLDFAVNEWWATSDYLYDRDEHLFFRDSTYFNRREKNGRKVFWSRGNGWVMGGLVRMLQFLPANHPARARFVQQFREMAERVCACQPADGFWRASLLDPDSYPMQETSGTGFYCYALAWGVNEGVLDRGRFSPPVRRAWAALVSCVTPEGKLTHVQPIGATPDTFDPASTEPYGVGAFLLAGSEVYRLVGG